MPSSQPNRRWHHLTPDRFFAGLLVVQVFLFLSERFQWFAFNQKKGWTVLIAVGGEPPNVQRPPLLPTRCTRQTASKNNGTTIHTSKGAFITIIPKKIATAVTNASSPKRVKRIEVAPCPVLISISPGLGMGLQCVVETASEVEQNAPARTDSWFGVVWQSPSH